ncbi:hypothetical protein NDU88_005130 [Pleurodeles waltl]|uniref:Uncharacterized protein n=1 Tax=Pleurodeles waltl TaxID=8319 RepID=A0AAV7LK78_PLEWA|nr:hypothetical protein NDU88_005130 [Pleurodeles waltl]
MRKRCLCRVALFSGLLSRVIVLTQLECSTLMSATLFPPSEQTGQTAGHHGISEKSSTNAGVLGEYSEATVSLPPSDLYTNSNTETAFQHSTETSATNHSQATVNRNANESLKEEDFNTTGTDGIIGLLSDSLAGGTVQQTTQASDWVTASSLNIENTAVEVSSRSPLPVTNSSLSSKRRLLLPGVTQPEMLRTSGLDGTVSPELYGMSYAEILAIVMGTFILTALVSSLTYQFLRSLWRKKTLERTCSVYIIENEMHKRELEVNHAEFETKL